MQAQLCTSCPTRRRCLAAGLDDEQLTSLSECVRPSAPMQRGDYLYRAGDRAKDAFVVRSGAYKTVVVSGHGQEHVTGFCFPGDFIGLSGQASGRYRDSAVALQTSTACRTALSDLPRLWEIGSGPALLRMLGTCERLGTESRTNLSRPAADARTAGFLVALRRRLEQTGRCRDHLPLPMSRTDLANHLGMTLESLSRVLGRFTRAGLIRSSRHAIELRDCATLESLAGHLDPYLP